MPFQLSPGVAVSEIDLTTVVPAVSTTTGALAGVFRWGPAEQLVTVDSENKLAQVMGRPTDINPETWFTAANFLAYGNQLVLSRALDANTFAALANTGGVTNVFNQRVKNDVDFTSKTFDANVQFVAKYPGELGNTLKISVCASANQFESTVNLASNTTLPGAFSLSVGSNTATLTFSNTTVQTNTSMNTEIVSILSPVTVGDFLEVGNNTIGRQRLKVTSIGTTSVTMNGANVSGMSLSIGFDSVYKLSTNATGNTIVRQWEFNKNFTVAPGQSGTVAAYGNTVAQDELHVVIVDEDGRFTGTPGTVLESYQGLSRATDGKTSDGAANYYKTVLNNSSAYVWAASDITGFTSATALNIASVSGSSTVYTRSFGSGVDGATESNIAFGPLALAIDLFKSADQSDISLIMGGKAVGSGGGTQSGNYIIDNVTEFRKDCIAFISPDRADVVNVSAAAALDAVRDFRNNSRSSSYAFLDSGYKYQYDKYNDTFRWVPLNGDMAGLCARTDLTNDPWYSPAGTNRGKIKNAIKLAFNPSKTDRDILYSVGVNPVVVLPGEGPVLYGDKTMLSKPSAFDRINVRRLFIVLEKAIARASQSTIFEFNDAFTRAQFVNFVEPYLRDVRSRKGITDFRVVCDETNNTPEIIDTNQFIGDIYIKPNRSINFIQLNFVAVRSGVEFSEIIGGN